MRYCEYVDMFWIHLMQCSRTSSTTVESERGDRILGIEGRVSSRLVGPESEEEPGCLFRGFLNCQLELLLSMLQFAAAARHEVVDEDYLAVVRGF